MSFFSEIISYCSLITLISMLRNLIDYLIIIPSYYLGKNKINMIDI